MTGTHFSLEEIRCMDSLVCEGNYEQALPLFQKAILWSKNQGKESAFLNWKAAICLDMLLEPLDAYEHIEKAIDLDGLNVNYQRSKKVILNKLEDFFIFQANLSSSYEQIRKIYKIMQRNGRLNDSIRVEFARYIGKEGKLEKAILLLDRVLGENPEHEAAQLLAEQFEMEKHKNAIPMNITKKAQ